MSHKVYYGNFTLYGAEKVEVRLARPVTVHDGIEMCIRDSLQTVEGKVC